MGRKASDGRFVLAGGPDDGIRVEEAFVLVHEAGDVLHEPDPVVRGSDEELSGPAVVWAETPASGGGSYPAGVCLGDLLPSLFGFDGSPPLFRVHEVLWPVTAGLVVPAQ